MEDTSLLIAGMVFGSIGMGFFIYGKRQKSMVPLWTGVGLFVLPYVISTIPALVIAGVVLMAIPYFVKI